MVFRLLIAASGTPDRMKAQPVTVFDGMATESIEIVAGNAP